MEIEISIVILCYKAGERIRGFVDKVIKLISDITPSWEIILVANYTEGTNDATPAIVKDISLKNENIKAIARIKEGMMGWDARSGLEKAAGKYICLIDGDEQMPAEDIIKVYKKITAEGLDFVTTYRRVRCDGMARKFISDVYNLIFNMLFPGAGIRDVNSKPKIFTQDAYHKMNLTSDDWFLDAEMIIQCRRLKLKVGEIPTTFYKCKYRRSYVNFYAIFEFINNLYVAKIKEFLKK